MNELLRNADEDKQDEDAARTAEPLDVARRSSSVIAAGSISLPLDAVYGPSAKLSSHTVAQWFHAVGRLLSSSFTTVFTHLSSLVLVFFSAILTGSTMQIQTHLAEALPSTADTLTPEDLDESIQRYRQLVDKARSEGDLQLSIIRIQCLTEALLRRYKHKGRVEDLEAQVALYEEALHVSGVTGTMALRASLLMCKLAEVLRVLSRVRGRLSDLEHAITLAQDAFEQCPPGHEDRGTALHELGTALWARYRYVGDVKDLEKSVILHQEALTIRPRGHSSRAETLNGMATSVRTRFDVSGDLDDLDRAIELHREGLELRVPGNPDRANSTNNLAHALRVRYHCTAEVGNLSEAVTLYREAVDMGRQGHPGYNTFLCNLAASLLNRAECIGESDDVDEAIALHGEALAKWPKHRLDRDDCLTAMAAAFQIRFNTFGDPDDLGRAAEIHREVLELRPQDHPLHVATLSCLGAVLFDKHVSNSQTEYLDEAISLCQRALHLSQGEHRMLYRTPSAATHSVHCELAFQLRTRFVLLGGSEDLECAVALYQEALQFTKPESIDRHVVTQGAAEALQVRFEHFHQPEDSYAALTLLHETLERRPPPHSDRSQCLFRMARLFLTPTAPCFDPVVGLHHLCDALSDSHRNAQLRLKDGLDVMSRLTEDWLQVSADEQLRGLIINAHRLMVGLLPKVAYFGLDIRSRLRVLSKAEDIANTAAEQTLLLSNPYLAVELLEEGRGIFWKQALHLRSPFDDLPPHLSQALRAVSKQLERDSHVATGSTSQPGDNEAGRRRRLTKQFENLLAEARSIPHLERFMLSESFGSFRAAAAGGPVIILLAGRATCQAIIIPNTSDGVLQVPLPTATPEWLKKMVFHVRGRNSRADGAGAPEAQRSMRVVAASQDRSSCTLAQLWDAVVKPVFTSLQLEKREGRARKRVWWCPTGLFAFLPLHAAGVYRGAVDCCSDYVVSSYTPTLSALLHARRDRELLVGEAKILLAAVPNPPNGNSLPFAAEEVRVITDVVPLGAIIALPPGEDSSYVPQAGVTLRTVLDKLPQASLLHLACHGHQACTDVLETGFIMQDGTLTIADLMRLRLSRASFAFLSACETAKGNNSQPDQTVHLAAAMLFAGFRSVVGTMWTMGDQDGPVIARAVYKELFKTGQPDFNTVPYALDEAVSALRAQNVPVQRWATYIHLGV